MADAPSLRQIAQSPTPFSAWLGVVLLFALFGVIVLAIVGPAPRGDNYEKNRAVNREKKLEELRKQDAAALTTYGWIDKQKGLARIPIDHAMELTMAELARKKPTAAGPVATPQPQPPAVPAPAAAASPSPSPNASAKTGSVESPGPRAQPAAATNPPGAAPGTQPGASASPAASAPPSAVPAVSPSPANVPSPPGSPLPVRGKTPESF